MFVAQGSAWSPATHHHQPDAVKAAIRTPLMVGRNACSVSASSGGQLGHAAGASVTSSIRLAALLLRILQLAAMPMTAWL